ncbi:hypothetical protein [Streptomyces sp. NBC_00483]|uniref:hypothetical protein n=1 Tax=Streptomyces sp. NBC_00483 TaxID=2975756 RepID=UPI002E1825D2
MSTEASESTEFAGKTALVTGATRKTGLALLDRPLNAPRDVARCSVSGGGPAGRAGPGRPEEDAETSMLALHLLRFALVHINTLLPQREGRAQRQLTRGRAACPYPGGSSGIQALPAAKST